jgi:hypothetical protein
LRGYETSPSSCQFTEKKNIYTSAGIPYCRCKHLTSQYVSLCCL